MAYKVCSVKNKELGGVSVTYEGDVKGTTHTLIEIGNDSVFFFFSIILYWACIIARIWFFR